MVHQVVKVTKVMVQLLKVIIVKFHVVTVKVQNIKHNIAHEVAQGLGHMIRDEIDEVNIHIDGIVVKIHGIVAVKIVIENVQHQEIIDAEADQMNDDEIMIVNVN